MNENEIASVLVDAALKIHRFFGPGLLESAYELALAYELEKRGLEVKRQALVPLYYEGILLEEGFRADLIVSNKLIVELKSVEILLPVHKKQVLTYLRLTGLKLGFLINFGAPLLKNGIERIVNGLPE